MKRPPCGGEAGVLSCRGAREMVGGGAQMSCLHQHIMAARGVVGGAQVSHSWADRISELGKLLWLQVTSYSSGPRGRPRRCGHRCAPWTGGAGRASALLRALICDRPDPGIPTCGHQREHEVHVLATFPGKENLQTPLVVRVCHLHDLSFQLTWPPEA